jgi:predicted phage terminase large subunit-like protein
MAKAKKAPKALDVLKKELYTRQLARKSMVHFVPYVFQGYQETAFHKTYLQALDLFAKGKIKNLILSMPPQHGKTEGSTRTLPAFILGNTPDKLVAIASYSSTQASKFHRAIQRYMDAQAFHNVFPGTRIPPIGDRHGVRNTEETEILGHKGSIKAVGRGGALTGNAVDIAIMDDLYKDAMEANSPIIRQSTIEWYDTVMSTRLHNDSQQLIVFTRWHEEDLVGYLEKTQTVHTLTSIGDLKKFPQKEGHWVKINFPAIQDKAPTELDPRELGVPLWPERHSLEKLENYRKKNPGAFASLYQGDPKPAEGLLYKEFGTYADYDRQKMKSIQIVTDTADKGADFLCSIVYAVGLDGYVYVLDVLYTCEGMEVTEPATARQYINYRPTYGWIEANNGGEGFTRSVKRHLDDADFDGTRPESFQQKENKEARILSNSTFINSHVLFPEGWKEKWPKFYRDLSSFRKLFKANLHDDAPDTLTLAVEKAGLLGGGESVFISLDIF